MSATHPGSLEERAKRANYTPPPFKFNPDLNRRRDLRPLLMDPERTALLVIDVQNLFTEPGAPSAASDGPKIVPEINKLVRYCRGHHIPVIWVQATNRRDGSDLGMYGKYWPKVSSWLAPDTHF